MSIGDLLNAHWTSFCWLVVIVVVVVVTSKERS